MGFFLKILEMELCSYEEDTYFTSRGNFVEVSLTDKLSAYALLNFHLACTLSDIDKSGLLLKSYHL